MSTRRLGIFDKELRDGVAPILGPHGFEFGDRRTFRRRVSHPSRESVWIIEFQVGDRYLAGMFTVNLAVSDRKFLHFTPEEGIEMPQSYHCLPPMTQRLGYPIENPPGLFWRLLRLLGLGPWDKWWKQSEDGDRMKETLREVTALLLTRGISWLEEGDRDEVFQRHWDDLQARRAGGTPQANPCRAREVIVTFVRDGLSR